VCKILSETFNWRNAIHVQKKMCHEKLSKLYRAAQIIECQLQVGLHDIASAAETRAISKKADEDRVCMD
jgi:hypothetical protein